MQTLDVALKFYDTVFLLLLLLYYTVERFIYIFLYTYKRLLDYIRYYATVFMLNFARNILDVPYI